jgi:RNA polymerase sigma factor (sigma-70 family)
MDGKLADSRQGISGSDVSVPSKADRRASNGAGEQARPTAEERERAALELITASGASVKRTARRYSLCAEDADDAYQRALEILLQKAPTTDAVALARWMHTVTKHEALAVRRNRERALSSRRDGDNSDWIETIPSTGASPAEHASRRERVARSREALHALKPQELRALVLKAEGYTYAEICKLTGWTHTKVNRCLAEGRKRFFEVYASIEEGRRCEELAPELSAYCDGESGAKSAVRVQDHLRSCATCRAKLREYRSLADRALGLLPLPASAHPLWNRVHDWIGNAWKISPGGDGATAAGHVAASGGTRGAGLAAAAKLLALCAGTAGAGAVCVATGVVPEPVRDKLPLIREHSPEGGAASQGAELTAPPDAKTNGTDPDAHRATPPPSASPPAQEFSPLGSSGGATASPSSSGGGGGGQASSAGGAGEFGP